MRIVWRADDNDIGRGTLDETIEIVVGATNAVVPGPCSRLLEIAAAQGDDLNMVSESLPLVNGEMSSRCPGAETDNP